MSTRRIIVERSIADAFTEKLVAKTAGFKVGDPKEHDTIIGPLINRQALSTVAARVQDAVDRGAKVLVGGETEGPCYRPTLVMDVPDDAPFSCEETFGPVASIEIVDDAEQAVARANATGYGLSAGIITGDNQRGFELASRIESGIVHVNDQTVGRRAADAVRRRQGLGLGPLRRPRRGRGVHGAAVGDRPGRHAALPVLGAATSARRRM